MSVTLELAHGQAWSCLCLQGNYIRLGVRDTGRIVHFPVCGKFCEFCGKFCEFSGKIQYPILNLDLSQLQVISACSFGVQLLKDKLLVLSLESL